MLHSLDRDEKERLSQKPFFYFLSLNHPTLLRRSGYAKAKGEIIDLQIFIKPHGG